MFKRTPKTSRPAGPGPAKAKKLNRRLSRQKVAKRQTKVKRPPMGAVIWALAGRPLKVLGAMALVAAVLLIGWSLLVMSPMFALREAEVVGTSHLSRMQVLRTAGLSGSDSLLAVKMGPAAKRIARMPWVASVRLERKFPHTVRIVVDERKARMLALAEGRVYYLDSDIRPIAAVGREATPDLPWLTGLKKADLVKPDEEVLKLMDLAGGLLDSLAKSGLGTPSEVAVDRVWGLSLITNQIAATLRLGFKDYGQRLSALKRVLGDLRQRGELERATIIDVEDQRRIVVRLGREPA